MGAVIDRSSLEVRLVLDPAGQSRVAHVDQRGHQPAGSLLEGVAPLTPPLGPQLLRDPLQGLSEVLALVVLFDVLGPLIEKAVQSGQVVRQDIPGATLEVFPELKDAAFGSEQDLLSDRRCLDPARRITEKLLEELRLRHPRLALHVASGKAVHRIGDGDQRERAHPIGDGGQIGRFLGIAAEEHRIAGRQQGVDVVVPRHDVQGVSGDGACCDLEHEAADLLAHRHIVGFQAVEDPLAR